MSKHNPTKRQYDVLNLVAQGMTNAEIAKQLRIKEITVKMTMYGLMPRIGASNRVQAVLWFQERTGNTYSANP